MRRSSSPPRKRTSRAPQDAARDAYRDELRLAAERMFASKGFAVTKMADIAGEAGVGVGTLYNYFANKQEIVEEIFEIHGDEIEALVDRAIEGQPPVEQLRAMLRISLEYLEKHAALFALYAERSGMADPDVERLGESTIERLYTRFLRKLEVSVRAAVSAGELRSDVPIWSLVAMLAGGRNAAAYAWLKGSREDRLPDMADEILSLFLSGARAPT